MANYTDNLTLAIMMKDLASKGLKGLTNTMGAAKAKLEGLKEAAATSKELAAMGLRAKATGTGVSFADIETERFISHTELLARQQQMAKNQAKSFQNTISSISEKFNSAGLQAKEFSTKIRSMAASMLEGRMSMKYVNNEIGKLVGEKKRLNAATAIVKAEFKKAGLSMDLYKSKVKSMSQAVAKGKMGQTEMAKAVSDIASKEKLNMLGALQNGLLGMGMSLLFTGMAIKRVAQGALTAVIDVYSKANGEQSEFNTMTNNLAANWAFFKYSMMDALMSTGLIEKFVNGLIQVINWFARLPDGVRSFIMIGLIVTIIISALMMIVGQMLLFILAFVAVETMSVKAGAAVWMSMAKMFWSTLRVFLIIVIVVAALYLLYSVWNNPNLTGFEKVIFTIMIIAAAVALIALLFGGWVVALVAAAVAMIAIIIIFRKEIWNLIVGLMEGLRYMLIGAGVWLVSWLDGVRLNFTLTFQQIGMTIKNIIWDVIIAMGEKIDGFINNLIRSVNSILPKKWKIDFRSNLVETLTSKKDNVVAAQQAKINETLAKIEANKKAKEDAVSLMNYGWDKMKDSVAMFKEEASAKINEMKNGVKEKKESLMPKPEELGMSDSYKALIDSNAKSNAKQEEQLEEQKRTNGLIEELLGVNKEQLTKGLDLKINGQSGSDLQNQLRDLDVQYNGSGNR